jgi:hypothetical protein
MTANSTTGRRKTPPRGRRSDAQKREAVLVFLQHPNLCQLSDREISRRTRVSQPFVSKLRKTVISAESPTARTGLITCSEGPTAGDAEAVFDPPALDPYAWMTAKPRDQRQVVDGIGLQELCNAASPDHRDAFVARLLAELPQNDRPERLPPNVEMYLDRLERQSSSDDGLDLPGFLRRRTLPDPELAEEILTPAEQFSGTSRRTEPNSSCPTTASTESRGRSSDDGGDE